MSKFIKCRLRVTYSDGERCKDAFVNIPEGSSAKQRFKAINSIPDFKSLIKYFIEDLYDDKIGRFGEVEFDYNYNLVKR